MCFQRNASRGKGLKQDYFIVVLAHSLHGRLQRVHIPHRLIYGALGCVAFLLLLMFGVVGSYARMASKVANYNSLQKEAQTLRARYDSLQRKVRQTNEQLASLQMLADEVTTAYGVKKQITGSADLAGEAPLVPTIRETLDEYDYLRTTNLAGRSRSIFAHAFVHVLPTDWPVMGRLGDGYGRRSDPFSGEGAMHTGLDIRRRDWLAGQSNRGRNRGHRQLVQRLRALRDRGSRQWLSDFVRPLVANRGNRRAGDSPGRNGGTRRQHRPVYLTASAL